VEESLLEVRKKVVDLEDAKKVHLHLEEVILEVVEDLQIDVHLIDQTEVLEEIESLLVDLEENVKKVR
jgi:hypothetical protein